MIDTISQVFSYIYRLYYQANIIGKEIQNGPFPEIFVLTVDNLVGNIFENNCITNFSISALAQLIGFMFKHGIQHLLFTESNSENINLFIENYIFNQEEERSLIYHPYADIAAINGYVFSETPEINGNEWQIARNIVNNEITDDEKLAVIYEYCKENIEKLPCAIIVLILMAKTKDEELATFLPQFIDNFDIPSFGLPLYVEALYIVYQSCEDDETVRSQIVYQFCLIESLGENIFNFGMIYEEFHPFFLNVIKDRSIAKTELFDENN